MVYCIAVHADLSEEVELLQFSVFRLESGQGVADQPTDLRFLVFGG